MTTSPARALPASGVSTQTPSSKCISVSAGAPTTTGARGGSSSGITVVRRRVCTCACTCAGACTCTCGRALAPLAPALAGVEVGGGVQVVPLVRGPGIEQLAVQTGARIAAAAARAGWLAEILAHHRHAALLRVHVLQQVVQPAPIGDPPGLEHRSRLVDLLARGRGIDPFPARGLDLLGHPHALQHRQHHAHPPFGQGQRHGQIAHRNFLALVAPGVQALGHGAGLVLGGVRFLEEVLLDGDVVRLEQQHAAGGLAVAAGAPRLLHVRLGRAGHVVVDDVADVGLVDAEAEGVGGDHHHLATRGHERGLGLLPLVRGHLAVVALDRDLPVAKRHVQLVDRAHGGAVDDARAAQALDELAQDAQLVRLAGDLAHVEGQIRPVEGDADDLGVLHPHLRHHVVGNRRGGGGGQTEDGGRPSTLAARLRPRYDGRKS